MLGRYSPGPSSFLNPVEPWFLTSNYNLDISIRVFFYCLLKQLNNACKIILEERIFFTLCISIALSQKQKYISKLIISDQQVTYVYLTHLSVENYIKNTSPLTP